MHRDFYCSLEHSRRTVNLFAELRRILKTQKLATTRLANWLFCKRDASANERQYVDLVYSNMNTAHRSVVILSALKYYSIQILFVPKSESTVWFGVVSKCTLAVRALVFVRNKCRFDHTLLSGCVYIVRLHSRAHHTAIDRTRFFVNLFALLLRPINFVLIASKISIYVYASMSAIMRLYYSFEEAISSRCMKCF